MKRIRILATLAAVTALVGATLGSPAGAAPRTERDIVETAVAAGKFTTLAAMLNRAGLVGALQKPGPYTVFAPTDAAFAKVPKATLNELRRDQGQLRAVLLYHVMSGRVTSARVGGLESAQTLNGRTVRLRTSGANVFVGGARVTSPDVMASNGVIHVVNRVLIPPAR